MRGLAHSWRLWLTRPAAVLFMLLNFMAGGAVAVPTIATAIANGHMIPAIGVHPNYRLAGTPQSGTFGCQQPGTSFPCYGPQQIQNAYNITPLLNSGVTGKGRTIVIIDAFGNPYIQDDLAAFDAAFGLPAAKLNVINPYGAVFDITDDNDVGWSGEISLDVQWAHAVAPEATIDLVIAKTNDDQDILNATRYAIEHNLGDTISQSFGENESCVDPTILKQEHQLFALAALKGMTVFASSGDSGAAELTCDGSANTLAASSPASDPLVTAVGGTNLTADLTTGAYQSETAWNDGFGESGGGFSVLYSRPFYQFGATGHNQGRGVPDVAYNAGVFGGVLTHWGVGLVAFGIGAATDPIFFIFGGTSAGSPQWAGIAALADQKAHHRVGFINPTLYAIYHSKQYAKDFHDITTGDNMIDGIGGFTTSTGWDAVTGIGTPDVANLLGNSSCGW